MRHHRTLALALVALALPVLALAQKTTYDFDKTAPLGSYKTYSMKDGTPAADPLMHKRIVAAIESQLAAKGFRRDDAAPDVFIVYHVAMDKEKDISGYSSAPMYGGYGWGWGGGWGTTTTDVRVRDITIGTLAVDMVDARKKQVVWRGLGTKELDANAKAEKRDTNVTKAVEKIFKNYPPKDRT